MIYVDLWFAVMPFESVIFFRLCVCPLTRAVRWTAVVAKFWEGGNGVRSPRFVMTFLRSFKTHGEVSWRCVWHFLNSTKALQKSNKPLLYCEFCGDCRNIQCICTFSRLSARSFAVVLKDKGTWMQCSSALLPVLCSAAGSRECGAYIKLHASYIMVRVVVRPTSRFVTCCYSNHVAGAHHLALSELSGVHGLTDSALTRSTNYLGLSNRKDSWWQNALEVKLAFQAPWLHWYL